MPQFTITAYQEMVAEQIVEADSAREAVEKFHVMTASGAVNWRPSDEDLEISAVTDENGEETEVE